MCLTQGFCNTFICDPEDTFSVASFKENFDIKLALASSHATITFDLEWAPISSSIWINDFWVKVKGQEIKYQSNQDWFLLFLSH